MLLQRLGWKSRPSFAEAFGAAHSTSRVPSFAARDRNCASPEVSRAASSMARVDR